MPLSLIKDPVTGKQYSRDTSVEGSTYQPYTAPASAKEETPTAELSKLPADTTPAGPLDNLRRALRMAAEEAGKERAAARLEQFQGAGLGRTPGTLGAIADIVRGSVRPDVRGVLSESFKGLELAEERKKSAFNMFNTMIDNGVLPDTPAGTLLAWEKEAGLPEGTALAWQARLKIAQDKSEEKADLELKLLRKEIDEKSKSEKPSNFIDVMQEYIDAGGTAEQAARKAAEFSEGQGIPVDQPTLNAWTEQARKLKKTVAPVAVKSESPIEKRIAELKRGGILNNSDVRISLKRQFTDKEIANSSVGSYISSTGNIIGNAVGSFFSGLFGQ